MVLSVCWEGLTCRNSFVEWLMMCVKGLAQVDILRDQGCMFEVIRPESLDAKYRIP